MGFIEEDTANVLDRDPLVKIQYKFDRPLYKNLIMLKIFAPRPSVSFVMEYVSMKY